MFARSRAVAAAAAAAVLPVLALPALVPAAPAGAATAAATHEVYPVPPSGTFTLLGRGWGHGHGLSQWGAYGAAKVKGLSAARILAFYYPHTTIAGQPLSTRIRVLLGGTADTAVAVAPISGATLSVSAAGLTACALPAATGTGTPITAWRAHLVSVSGSGALQLQRTTDGTKWVTVKPAGCAAGWGQPVAASMRFTDGGRVRYVSRGTATTYRGQLVAALTGAAVLAVNDVPLESYLLSVVPSEMPASWSPAALQAQAVAARTYASYSIAHARSSAYDVYDDTRDQMYTGVGAEYPSSTDAVHATENGQAGTAQVLHDANGHLVFAQFASADGGWTVAGGQPYLVAQADPYDGLVPNSAHAWTTTLSAGAVQNAYPGVGTLRSIVVTGRDGNGVWGGRVTTLELHGSAGTVQLTGSGFRWAFGLRSEWFRVLEPPAAPAHLHVERSGSTATVQWDPPVPNGGAAVTGYRVTTSPGTTTQTVPASTTTARLTGLASGTSYRVTVVPTSSAGNGWSAVATTVVHRIAGGSTDVAVSAASYGTGRAGAVLLAPLSSPARAIAAAPLARAVHAPLLWSGADQLPTAVRHELVRVLPKGRTVYLLGTTQQLQGSLSTTLKGLGYRVTRLGGASAADTAAAVADRVVAATTVTSVVEVAAGAPAVGAVAAAAAARHGAVVLLTAGTTQSAASRTWLQRHPKIGATRFAVGATAQSADPGATAVGGTDRDATAVAVARRWFPRPGRFAIAAGSASRAALDAACRNAVRTGGLLLADPTSLSADTRAVLHDNRPSLTVVELVGPSLPYDDVEAQAQRALL